MEEHVLVLNAGSSSLKFSIFQRTAVKRLQVTARGQIEGIGTAPRLSVRDGRGEVLADEKLTTELRDGRAAIDTLAAWLRSRFSNAHLLGVGHRVVHGGPRFSRPILVTQEILAELFELTALAPLHQPGNLAPMGAIFDQMPDVPQVACFDTGFHRGREVVANLVPLPGELRQSGIERYGFHGIS